MTNIVFRPLVKKNHPNVVRNSSFSSQENKSIPVYTNIKDKDKEYEIQLTVPGFEKEQLKIELDNQKLKISGSSNGKMETKYHLNEINYSNFERVFIIPENANLEEISAIIKSGILYVNIPKQIEKPVKIINVI